MKELIRNCPIPLAGVSLGIVSLGSLLRSFSDIVYFVGLAIAAVLVVLLIARAILFTDEVRADFRNPVFASVSGTFTMTLMQISAGLAVFMPREAFVLWIVALAGHAALIVWFSVTFVRRFNWNDVVPTYFITYVGIIVASVTAPTFDMQVIGQVLFLFGFATYAILLVAVTYRMATRPLPDATKPLICIYAAPMSLSLTGYLAVSVQPNIAFVCVLAVAAQVLLAFVLMRLPKLFKLLHGKFFPSIAAMTFPFVITATGLSRTCVLFDHVGVAYPTILNVLVTAETVLAVAMVLYACIRYCIYFVGAVQKVSTAQSATPIR